MSVLQLIFGGNSLDRNEALRRYRENATTFLDSGISCSSEGVKIYGLFELFELVLKSKYQTFKSRRKTQEKDRRYYINITKLMEINVLVSCCYIIALGLLSLLIKATQSLSS